MIVFALGAVLFQVQDLRANPCPYVLVTTSGERVGSLDKPNHDGKPVKFRLCANGGLTMMPARDVDWAATEAENAAGPRENQGTYRYLDSATPVPTPTRATVSSYAKSGITLDAEAAVKRNALSGKLKVGDREVVMDGSGGFFGQDSIARYVEVGEFVADTRGCPFTRAQAYGIVRNTSSYKLRGLRALVAVVGLTSGEVSAQIQSMNPSELMPGERADIYLWLSCSFASRSSATPTAMSSGDRYVVVLPDIAGKVEALSQPEEYKPAATPAPTKEPAARRPGG